MKDVSAWVLRWSPLVASGASVLDVACGTGRHVRWFASRGCRVLALDRDAAALATLGDIADTTLVADLESSPWPLPGRRFDAVVVTNYLHRPLMPLLVDSVADGGFLIHETFALGQAGIGRPANPDFLLRPGELLEAVRPLRVIAYEDGYEPGSSGDAPQASPRYVQRIVAVRESRAALEASPLFPRYPIGSGTRASG